MKEEIKEYIHYNNENYRILSESDDYITLQNLETDEIETLDIYDIDNLDSMDNFIY